MPSAPDLPHHLSLTESQGLVKQEPIAQFEIGSMRNFVYLILDWKTRQAAIVDPQSDLSAPLESLEKNGFRLSRILLTHTHHDHIAGVPELRRRFPEVAVHVHADDVRRLPPGVTSLVKDGDEIMVGDLLVRAIHTPGHSAGEVCYFIPSGPGRPGATPFLLTGDTVFIRDCGRTDLDTGSDEEMFVSLRKIAGLPAESVILPGHHYARECASTLARELLESPPFRCRSVDELRALP